MIWLKLVLITMITAVMFYSLWKTAAGIIIPPVLIWVFNWYTGFTVVSLKVLLIFSGVHIVIEILAFFLSNKHREANLALTGAGITGFGTGILATLFFGGLLGFFMWLGLIGRLVTEPIALGVSNIARSFSGGLLKVIYAMVMPAFLAYILF